MAISKNGNLGGKKPNMEKSQAWWMGPILAQIGSYSRGRGVGEGGDPRSLRHKDRLATGYWAG